MQLDHDQLQKLLALLGESDIQELKLEGDDFRLEVRRNLPLPPAVVLPSAAPVVAGAPVAVASVPATSPSASTAPPAAAAARGELLEITAPMVGTFYRAPAPGEPNFIEVGQRISIGQTVCILEAMKLMNELETEHSGEIVEILVDNGTPVEFGQVLIRVKPV